MTEPTSQTSKYWLGPGIDVPTTSDSSRVLSKPRPLPCLFFDKEAGDAAFIPSDDFMSLSPDLRIDMIDDVISDLTRTRTHALVERFREFQANSKNSRFSRQLAAFRFFCETFGIDLPEDLESLLAMDAGFRDDSL